MSGTAMAYGATELRAYCAAACSVMSGTKRACGTNTVHACCAMSGTVIACGTCTKLPWLPTHCRSP
eukprot:647740-Rhodomonas_salina.6